jgi:hypothetical protein
VYVTRIVVRGANNFSDMPVDHPDLSEGWWAVERNGEAMGRWTDGDAVLPLPVLGGATVLEVRLVGEMTYVTTVEPEAEVECRAIANVQ